MFGDFFHDKRVLVTGHTGFKGGWLALWLQKLGAEVWGVSLPAATKPNLYDVIRSKTFAGETKCDVRDEHALTGTIRNFRPDVIFHLAAQALVRRSYAEPLETLAVNALGTANVLEAVRYCELPCTVIVVTSDKCYENREWSFAYRENDPLGGHDVYSMSKAAAELIAQSWTKSFFLPNPKLGSVVTARAGNVIGGGDYAPDRIVPDCVRALSEDRPIVVRNPEAVRPWQHVLECLSGYLWLAARVTQEPKGSLVAGTFNFGPEASSRWPVRRLVEEVLRIWPGKWVDGSQPNSPHEAKLLTLSIDKARALLSWFPVWETDEAIRHTISWYAEHYRAGNDAALRFSETQIDAYVEAARLRKLAWVN